MTTKMKLNKILIPVLAATMVATSCDDEIMEWGTPEGHYAVSAEDIPLAVQEVLANYDDITNYANTYIPQMIIGIGMGADLYVDNENGEQDLADANFTMFTCGNAMKHDAIVGNSGSMTFTTVDDLCEAISGKMDLYGHNFIWHTQQNQTYLKSLIAPTLVVETDGDIANVLSDENSTFDGGTTGDWSSWGNSSTKTVEEEGEDGSYCLVLVNPSDASSWSAQCAYTFDYYLDTETTYVLRFDCKASSSSCTLQNCYQNSTTYSSQGYSSTYSLTTEWQTFEWEFTPAYDDVDRILFNFGAVAGTYYIDNIEFGEKVEDPMENVISGDSYDFEGGTAGNWSSWGSNKESAEVVEGAGYNDSYGMVLTNAGDGNSWEAQFAYTFDDYLEYEKSYIIQFYAKSSTSAGQLQFQYQNGSTYGSQGGYNTFSVGTDWILCEYQFTVAYEDVNRIILNFGAVGGTYYVDNIKFGLAIDQDSEAKATQIKFNSKKSDTRSTRASTSYYVLKSADEKREALLTAMDAWIGGMADHLAEIGVTPYGYDVINEPITDSSNKIRGVDAGYFGGSWTNDDGDTEYDSEPEEDEENGLTLNWGDGHFYWGYYVSDYALQAFQMARQYLPSETKLFVNDYNLEYSPSKLAALIAFVDQIDADNGSDIVDGIGTQMHISLSTSDDEDTNAEAIAELKEQVDEMFVTLAATGKLVRVTELDVALGTSSPSSAQYEAQSDCYQMIMESYKENIPESQQSGITIWSLSDNENEHLYWLNGDAPNLFDSSYKRKWAYKGFCDGIAGEDLGLQYGGDDYKAYYENDNVSSTVSE